jgi:hypothetical protein
MVNFSGQLPPVALEYVGIVVNLTEEVMTFRDVKSNKDQPPVNFAFAEIRPHSYDATESTNAFVVLWEDGLQSVTCVLTEMRADQIP